jgi:hypothetical protein
MGRNKGTHKTGGRKAGTANKSTTNIREKIFKLVSDNMETLESDILCLEPEKRIDVVIKLLPYAAPKVLPAAELMNEKKSAITDTLNLLARLKEKDDEIRDK